MHLFNLTKDLGGKPAFHQRRIWDKNPLMASGNSAYKKFRTVHAPNKAMAKLHRRLLQYVRALRADLSMASACKKGCSHKKHALTHAQDRRVRYFYHVDLSKFFPSITKQMIINVLVGLDNRLAGQEKELGDFLDQFCLTGKSTLITGAPSSQDIANLVAAHFLDRPLAQLIKQKDWPIIYNRYLDDLTFSSRRPIGKRKTKQFCQLIRGAGFIINLKKTRHWDLEKGPIQICGITIQKPATPLGQVRLSAPGWFQRKTIGLLHLARKGKAPINKAYGYVGACQASSNLEQRSPNHQEKRLQKAHRRLKHKS